MDKLQHGAKGLMILTYIQLSGQEQSHFQIPFGDKKDQLIYKDLLEDLPYSPTNLIDKVFQQLLSLTFTVRLLMTVLKILIRK